MPIEKVECPKCHNPDCGGLTSKGICIDCDMKLISRPNTKNEPKRRSFETTPAKERADIDG